MATFDYRKMNLDDIIAYCKEKKEVEWLKETANKVYPNVDGTFRTITFIELKLEFCKKFMPSILPVAKPKKPTMIERIQAL